MHEVTVTVVFGLLLTLKCYDDCVGEYVDLHKDLESYKFNPEIGNCYELYDEYEDVTSLICQRPLDSERYSCIDLIITEEKYCLGLITPTNETVQLHCENSVDDIFSYYLIDELSTCFNISRADGNYREVCQKKFDNYSVGITTPDNFTILFYSEFCSTSISDEEWEIYDDFINTFSFDSETKRCYKIFNEYQNISPYTCLSEDVFTACVDDLSHIKHCEGIVTQNNETIILDCTEDRGTLQNHSCFEIYTADNTLHIEFQNKVEERCIGIKTPSNLIVLLECYFCTDSGMTYGAPEEELREYGIFITTYLSNEYLGKNSYIDKSKFMTFNENIAWKIPKYLLQKSTVYGYWLANATCYGVTLPSNETVILECLASDRSRHIERGCFLVNNLQLEKEQEQVVCIKVIDRKCVGITTPMNWSIEFGCYSENDESDYVDWHKNFDNYKFYPEIGKCYEIYDQHEKVTPFICQRPANTQKQSCIDFIDEEESCLGLKTPTNETVEFHCENLDDEYPSYLYHNELNTCFNVTRPDESYKEVCQQKFDKYSAGITTPDNFTILFDSYFCSTSMSDIERQIYSNFIDTFSFDPEIKRCYKIYNEHQNMSPFTCLNEDVFTSCVHELSHVKNCEGIVTQNNETVVLHCTYDIKTLQHRNCFKIYTANNSLHITCQKKVEERCIGITTPSNLTVLLDCYFCIKSGIRYIPEDVERRRRSWKFVTSYLSNEMLGKNSYLGKLHFKASQETDVDFFEFSKKISTVYSHWLPNSNCYGTTLDGNEIIILGCLSKETLKHIKSGCYLVINLEMKTEEIVCSKILDEACVGITSPMKWSIALACYSEYYKSTPDIIKESYTQRSAEDYTMSLTLNNCYEFYSSQDVDDYSCTKSANPKNYSCVHWLPGERRCLGLKTPANEVIEFICEGSYVKDNFFVDTFSTHKHCFNVYKSSNYVEEICLQKIGNFSIGVTTSSNYSILLDSYFCSTFKTPQNILEYKQFVDTFVFDPTVRSCYKVYTPDQDISPYTCSSNEIYDACIHLLESTSCMGITTQNNETVILQCLNSMKVVNETGCFKIYTTDNQIHITCQKQVEERCIGIITPSNLTVLLECQTCISTKGGTTLPIYSDNYRKSYRKVVDNFIDMFTQNNYALEDKMHLKAYTPEQDIKLLDCYSEIRNYNIHILYDHGRCRGITLDNLETIILGCPNKKPEKAGCFDVFRPIYGEDNKIIRPEVKVGDVCVKILNEWCVGITTPQNWTVPLSCFFPPAAVCGVITVPDNGPPMV